jgi:predicted  nucleic acid-binding Zn-ribbon protein
MFNSQFSQLEQSIQRLLQDNQQLQQALLQKEAELQAQRDELELLQLGMMESEEQAQQAASRLDALLALFPQAAVSTTAPATTQA